MLLLRLSIQILKAGNGLVADGAGVDDPVNEETISDRPDIGAILVLHDGVASTLQNPSHVFAIRHVVRTPKGFDEHRLPVWNYGFVDENRGIMRLLGFLVRAVFLQFYDDKCDVKRHTLLYGRGHTHNTTLRGIELNRICTTPRSTRHCPKHCTQIQQTGEGKSESLIHEGNNGFPVKLSVLLSVCLDIAAMLLHSPRSHLQEAGEGEEESCILQNTCSQYLEASAWRS